MTSLYSLFEDAVAREVDFLSTHLPESELKTNLLTSYSDTNYNGLPLPDRRTLVSYLQAVLPTLPPEARPQALRVRSKIDLFYLCKGILGFTDLTVRTHKDFCEFEENPLYSRKLAMLPRSFFKTTISTIARSVQLLLNSPTIRILIANSTQTNASKFLMQIEAVFEDNTLIRELFPELIPDNFRSVRWNSEEMELRRPTTFAEASVEAIGVGGTAVSRHYDVILKDDLVSEDQLVTREQMKKVIDWNRYAESLFVNQVKAIDVHTGTRWAYYDLLSHVMETDKSYQVYHLPCWTDETKTQSTFPERFPVEVLNKIRERQGRMIFSCQYENDPLPSEARVFETELVHRWKALGPLTKDLSLDYRLALIIDPALGLEGSTSDTAILVEGWGSQGERVVLEALALQIKPMDMIQKALDLADKYDLMGYLVTIYFESVLFQRVLKPLFDEAMITRGHLYRVEMLIPSTKRSKEQRIEVLDAPVNAGKLWVREGPEGDTLLDQLAKYPAGKMRDLLDVLAYGEQVVPVGIRTMASDEVPSPESNIMSLDHILDELDQKHRSGLGLFTNQIRGMVVDGPTITQ